MFSKGGGVRINTELKVPHPPAPPTYGCLVVANEVDVEEQEKAHSQCKTEDKEEQEESVEPSPVSREGIHCRRVEWFCNVALCSGGRGVVSNVRVRRPSCLPSPPSPPVHTTM